jgi:N utilization substance protein B
MKRRVAREIALQVLYQMEMNRVAASEAIRIAIEEAENDNEANLDVKADQIEPQYIKELVDGTERHLKEIDDLLHVYLQGWRMDRLSRVDRQVLRLAVYEMVYRDDVPPKVVVNEAIELAKHFGTEESGKFVNGVLGRMIKELDNLKTKALQKNEQ